MECFAEKAAETTQTLEAAKGHYESLYSRALWPASNFAAALIKVQNPKIRWTAEFSDPILLDIHGKPRQTPLQKEWLSKTGILDAIKARGFTPPATDNLFAWCEYLPYFLADELLFTNPHQLTYMMSYLNDPELVDHIQQRAIIIPQPTLPEKFYSLGGSSYNVDNDHVNIGYFGSFYATRGLNEVLEAFKALPAKTRKQVRFHIFTNQSDIVNSKGRFSEIEEHIVLNRYVDYFDFLSFTKMFDCLLVNDATTIGSKPVNPYLPSKVSDYLGSGTPIWGICEPGSTLASMCDAGTLTYRSQIGDLQSQKDVLNSLTNKPKAATPKRGKRRGTNASPKTAQSTPS
jgi:glycosyltransferase involved in cell wall biosynthesis